MLNVKNVKFNIIESSNPKYVEVVVTYQSKNQLNHHYIFLTKQNGLTNKDYLKQAKIQFEEDLKNHRVRAKANSNKRGLVFATSVLAATTIALGSFLTYKLLNPDKGGGENIITYDVQFDPKEGSWSDGSKNKIVRTVKKDELLTDIPNNPIGADGFTFKNWLDESGNVFNFTSTVISRDMLVSASYEAIPTPVEGKYEFDFAGVGCVSNNTSFKAPEGYYEFIITSTETDGILNDSPTEITVGGVSIINDKSKYTYKKTSDKQATLSINNVTGDLYIEVHSHNSSPTELLPTVRVSYQVPNEYCGAPNETLIKFYTPSQNGEKVMFQHDNDSKIEVTNDFVEYDFKDETKGSVHTLTIFGNIDLINANHDYYDAYAFGAAAIFKCELLRDLGKPHEYSSVCIQEIYRVGKDVHDFTTTITEATIADGVVTLPNGFFQLDIGSTNIINSDSVIYIPDSVQRINEDALTVYFDGGSSTSDAYLKLNSNIKYIEANGVKISTEVEYTGPNYNLILYTSLKEIPDNYKNNWINLFFSHVVLDCSTPPLKHTSSDNKYHYYLSDSGDASLYAYTGEPITTGTYEIPESIDGHIVTSINGDFNSSSTIFSEPGLSSLGIIIPLNIKYIFNRAFCYADIDDIAFKGDPNNSQLEYIGSETFSWVSLEGDIVIPDSVKRIGYDAFCGASSDDSDPVSISLSKNLIYLGSQAFANTNIKEINFPKSLINIGSGVVSGCPYLQSIKVDNDNPYYSDCGMNVVYEMNTKKVLSGTKDFTLPEGVTEIGNYAYSNVVFDDAIVIPNTVTKIGYESFYQSTIPDLSFEENSALKYIDGAAFETWNDNKIEGQIILPEGLIYIEADAFYNNDHITSIYLPDSLKDGYVGFSVFGNWKNSQTVSYPNQTSGWDENWNYNSDANFVSRPVS